MKKVFISHPLSDDIEEYRKKVNEICKEIMEEHHNILPISPLHLFSFIEEETDDLREEIMKVCYSLIDDCQEVWIYIYDFKKSKGQRKEFVYTLENDIKFKLIPIRGQ